MKENLIECVRISVDCITNDPVDIRCGGPQYLGFDFFIRETDKEEMIEFIISVLQSLGVPLLRIDFNECNGRVKDKIWTKERILTCIRNDSNYLINEAKRNYSPNIR